MIQTELLEAIPSTEARLRCVAAIRSSGSDDGARWQSLDQCAVLRRTSGHETSRPIIARAYR